MSPLRRAVGPQRHHHRRWPPEIKIRIRKKNTYIHIGRTNGAKCRSLVLIDRGDNLDARSRGDADDSHDENLPFLARVSVSPDGLLRARSCHVSFLFATRTLADGWVVALR